MRRAFTLIELLVVIAIIAILAAILFPVFAQAKAAAKATGSLSNSKQDTLGCLMYAGDYDDNLPMATYWNTGQDQLCYGSDACFAVWSWVVQPYVKNSNIFLDPLGAPNPDRGQYQRNFDTYYIQYGLNGTWISPDYNPGSPGKLTSTTQTSFAQPASTVLLATKWADASNQSGYDWGTGFPPDSPGELAAVVVDAPDCFYTQQWCLYGWGGDGSSSFYDGVLKLSNTEGGRTGGVALRANGKAVVGWLDGHAGKYDPAYLAQGTDWSWTAPGGVSVLDFSKYLWDNQ